MGGAPLASLIDVFKGYYIKFLEDNRYVGFTPALLHAKAMAYARDELAASYPITLD